MLLAARTSPIRGKPTQANPPGYNVASHRVILGAMPKQFDQNPSPK
jgi:hypothetical protein